MGETTRAGVTAPDLDTSAAEGYEECLAPAMFAAWAAWAAATAAPRRGDRVLDLACGTALALRHAASRVGPQGRLVGVDLDPAMLAVARRLTQSFEHPPALHCADAAALPLESSCFDLCVCLQGLQFFGDRVSVLREVRRVLAPGGQFLATAWVSLDASPGHRALVEALQAQGVDTTAARRGFSVGPSEALLDAVRASGLVDVRLEVREDLARFASVEAFVDAIARGSPSARFSLAALAQQRRGAFEQDLRDRLAAYVHEEDLRWPMQAYVLRARRSLV
jgi:SAM-dependent methyltransferase